MIINYTNEEKLELIELGRKQNKSKKFPYIIKYMADLPIEYKTKKILDFGSGFYCPVADKLKSLGFNFTYAYDFEENMTSGSELFDKKALTKKWDFIILNDVLDSQPNSVHVIDILINLFFKNLNDSGKIIFNIYDIDFDDFKYTIIDLLDRELEILSNEYYSIGG